MSDVIHETSITVTPGTRYPYRPSCSCGQLKTPGYLTELAAQIVAEGHVREESRDGSA